MQEMTLQYDTVCVGCSTPIERGISFADNKAAVCSRCLNTAARQLHEAAARASHVDRLLGGLACQL